jgi:two-component system cell cycle response regulator DivK
MNKPDNRDAGEGRLILIVDDFADARELMGDYLRHWGYQVAEAADGSEAMIRAESIQPDVILMDMSMPIVDGWEATRFLKANPKTQHIPIVALTSHALIGSSDPAFQAGCDAFLARPCPPQRVLAEVQRLTRKSKTRDAVRAK